MSKTKSDDSSLLKETINFQLFTSVIMARNTFLMNINTGETWQLVVDNTDKDRPEYWWSLMP